MEETIVRPAAPRPVRQKKAGGCATALLNSLALLLVVLSCVSVIAMGALFQNPQQVLNAVPGGSALILRTLPAVAQLLPSPTPGTVALGGHLYPTLPPVWTPTDTPTITGTPLPASRTPIPSSTSAFPSAKSTRTKTPTATATRPTPTRTGPTPLPSVTRSVFNFTLQPGSPTYLGNFLNDNGCNWFGIVGRVFGSDGNPVINLTVHLEGGGINMDVLTGSGPSALGPGGYQIPLSDHPIDTTNTYLVQLRNNSGTHLSDVFAIRTYGDCPRNLVLVNFVQNH